MLRTSWLLTVAALRRGGWVPWLAVLLWLGLCVAQEPRMLRAFGIDLTNQSAWVATGALAVMVGSGQPTSRGIFSYLIAANILTLLSAAVVALCVAAFELARGARPSVLVEVANAFPWTVIWVPVAIFASLVAHTPTLLPRFLLVISVGVAANLVPRIAEHGWSASTLLASICNLVAASVTAHDCCQKKI